MVSNCLEPGEGVELNSMWAIGIVFALLLIVALSSGWLVWVSRFVWEDQKLAVRYAAISGAATIAVMLIGMEKL